MISLHKGFGNDIINDERRFDINIFKFKDKIKEL